MSNTYEVDETFSRGVVPSILIWYTSAYPAVGTVHVSGIESQVVAEMFCAMLAGPLGTEKYRLIYSGQVTMTCSTH